MIARVVAVVLLTASFGVVNGGGACVASAQTGPDNVGIVIETADLRDEFCVNTGGERMAAIDVLARTGLDVVVQDFGGDQLTLCRVGEVGCERDDCFCACADPDQGCTFWGVYELEPDGSWTFAQVGLGEMMLGPGDVLGLRWDVQTPDGGAAPQTPDPEAVCTRASLSGSGVFVTSTDAEDNGSPIGLGVAAVLFVLWIGMVLWYRRIRRAR